jgi:hypothetical protein
MDISTLQAEFHQLRISYKGDRRQFWATLQQLAGENPSPERWVEAARQVASR